MKELIKQIRLVIFVELIRLATVFLPKNCIKTLLWLEKMPLED